MGMRIILTFKGLNKVIRLSLHYRKGLYKKKNRLAIKSLKGDFYPDLSTG
jgi:hypothetical protein